MDYMVPADGQPIVPQSPSRFSRTALWVLVVLVMLVLLVAGGVYYLLGMFSDSDAVNMAMQLAQANPVVIEKLGTPIEKSKFVSGSISINNTDGKADLSVPVTGPKGKGTLQVDASRKASKWALNSVRFTLDGDSASHELVPSKSVPNDITH